MPFNVKPTGPRLWNPALVPVVTCGSCGVQHVGSLEACSKCYLSVDLTPGKWHEITDFNTGWGNAKEKKGFVTVTDVMARGSQRMKWWDPKNVNNLRVDSQAEED